MHGIEDGSTRRGLRGAGSSGGCPARLHGEPCCAATMHWSSLSTKYIYDTAEKEGAVVELLSDAVPEAPRVHPAASLL